MITMKVKARSENKPAPSAAEAFAKLLAAAQLKRPELKLVEPASPVRWNDGLGANFGEEDELETS